MIQAIIEEIASTLASAAVEAGLMKGRSKNPALFGWISLISLFVIIMGVTALGIFLIRQNVAVIGILMFLIAALILWITFRAIWVSVRARKKP